jgi:hypothetical protein
VTILERYQSRFDVRDREGSLVAICKSHTAAQAFIELGDRPSPMATGTNALPQARSLAPQAGARTAIRNVRVMNIAPDRPNDPLDCRRPLGCRPRA